MYDIVTVATARTYRKETVDIAIFQDVSTKQRFWRVFSDTMLPEDIGPFSEMVFVEPDVPSLVRQLFGVMVGRRAKCVFEENTQTYHMYGASLVGSRKLYHLGYNNAAGILPNERLVVQMRQWTNFEWIFDMLNLPRNRPFANAVLFGARWKRRATLDPCRRAHKRTALIKEELMAVTWHPHRMVAWCMDVEEHAEYVTLTSSGSEAT